MTRTKRIMAIFLIWISLVFMIPHEAFAEPCPHLSEESCSICEVEALIDALPALEDMNGTHIEQLTEATSAYDALDVEQQSLVSNADKLSAIRTAFASSEEDIYTAELLGGLEPLLPSCTHGTAFTKTSGNISAGNYYLTGNRSLSDTIYVQDGVTVNLCLNGYALSGNNSFLLFQVLDGGVVNLYDCGGSGKVTGGNYNDEFGCGGAFDVHGEMTMYGGTISGNTCPGSGGGIGVNSGIFYMYGGTITGNSSPRGGGVGCSGTFYMYGGNITGNTSSMYGGGIFQTVGSKVYIEGGSITNNTAASAGGGIYKDLGNLTFTYGPYIAGNTVNGSADNIYLYNNQKIKIGYDGLNLGTPPIGITTMTAPTSSSPVNITTTVNTDYSNYFTSDNPSYGVRYNSGVMQLYVANFRYIYYNANGGSGSMSTTQLSDGQVAFIQENAFTRPGYRFTGWNTAANGSGTSYSPGGILEPLSSMTLYAQWEPDTYTLSFNANGGSGSMTSQSVSNGSSIKIPTNTFSRSRYVFKEWNTKANGSGVSYSDGAYITISGDVTLYAQWEQVTSYIIILPDGDNIIVDSDTKTGFAAIGIQSGATIPDGKSLQMSVNAGTHYSNGYRLQNQTGGQYTTYQLSYKGNAVDPGAGANVAILETASADTAYAGFENDISVAVGASKTAGVYIDVLTFLFAVV